MVLPVALIGPGIGAITQIFGGGGLLSGGRSAAQVCRDTTQILNDFISGKRNDLPWARESTIRASYTRDVFRSKAQANCGNIFPDYSTLIAARLAKTGPLPDDISRGVRRIPPEIRQSNQPPVARALQSAKNLSPIVIGTIVAIVIGGGILLLFRAVRR